MTGAGMLIGFMVTTGLLALVPAPPSYAAPAVVAFQTLVVTPGQKLYWDQDAASVVDAQGYRITAYVGAQADKAIANPADPSLTGGVVLTFTCVVNGSTFRCTSTATAQQLAGTTAPGTYRVALVAERKKADGTYASKVVTQLCTFQFQDLAPSVAPKNLGFAD
jgi:hypothetical protein